MGNNQKRANIGGRGTEKKRVQNIKHLPQKTLLSVLYSLPEF